MKDWNNKLFVIDKIKQRANNIRSASDELKNDKEVALIAIKKSGFTFEHLSSQLKNDREIVIEAIKESSKVLQYASNEFKNNKSFAIKMAELHCDLIGFISDELKNDIEILYYILYYSIHCRHDKHLCVRYIISKYEKLIPIKYIKKYKSLEKIQSVFYIYIQKDQLNNVDKFGGDFDLLFYYSLL
jgi:hypothetical protein